MSSTDAGPDLRCWRTWPSGDVLGVAVAIPGADDHLSVSLGLRIAAAGKTSMALNAGIVLVRPRRAGGDPVGEQAAIIGLSDFELAVRRRGHRHGRLAQQTGCGRLLRIDAAAKGLPREDEMIARRIVAAQRELEAALAGERAVTGPRVAADARQHGMT